MNKRNSYADMGLVIAMSILIAMSIKCILFDANWEAIILIISAVAYCIASYKFDSESKVVRHSTTSLLIISIVIFAAMLFFDRKPQPKMHAFEGAKTDTIAEEEFILSKEPELATIIEDTTEIPDTLIVEDVQVEEEETYENEETNEAGEENNENNMPATEQTN